MTAIEGATLKLYGLEGSNGDPSLSFYQAFHCYSSFTTCSADVLSSGPRVRAAAAGGLGVIDVSSSLIVLYASEVDPCSGQDRELPPRGHHVLDRYVSLGISGHVRSSFHSRKSVAFFMWSDRPFDSPSAPSVSELNCATLPCICHAAVTCSFCNDANFHAIDCLPTFA